jgi:hypothetical protein
MVYNKIIKVYNKIIKVYNKWHLGDNIFNIIFLNKISKYLENNKILVKYFLQPQYKKQVSEFNNTKNIILLDYKSDLETKFGLHLWIASEKYKFKWNHDLSKIMPYNIFLTNFFNQILGIWKFPVSISSIIYRDPNLLRRYNLLDNKFKNIDILFINSIPLSGQFSYNEDEWKEFINKFSNYNIVTTKKIPDFKCTLDNDLTIKDIASISINCKVIIMINTGIVPGLLNIYTLQNVKQFYSLDLHSFYKFNFYNKFKNFKYLKDIDVNDVISYLN